MTHSIVQSNFNEDIFNNTIFLPKLKLDNDISFPYNNNENNPYVNNIIKDNKINTLNQMSFLFPSIPVEVSTNFIFL